MEKKISKKILLIEDEDTITELVLFGLKARGYQMITARDGEEGFNKLVTDKPDLVLLDIMVPKIDGYQFCQMVKSDEQLKNIPIVVLSALAQRKEIERAAELGADEYVTKPFQMESLVSIIRKYIG